MPACDNCQGLAFVQSGPLLLPLQLFPPGAGFGGAGPGSGAGKAGPPASYRCSDALTKSSVAA